MTWASCSTTIRRLLVALLLGAMVPASTATLVCQVRCAVEELDYFPHGGGHRHGLASDKSQTHVHAKDIGSRDTPVHVSHAGPCQFCAFLASTSIASNSPCLPEEWANSAPDKLESFVSPPPEHRPKV